MQTKLKATPGPWTECSKAEHDQYHTNPNDGDGWTYETRTLYTHSAPLDSDTRKQLLDEFPLLDDEGLSETEHHCEWAIQQDRKRLHKILKRLEAGE